MQHLTILLSVAAGGALGSVLRYAVTHRMGQYMHGSFPYGVLLVNILGSLLIGLAIAYLARTLPHTHLLRSFMVIGVLGGFTTFSSFSLDVVTLVERAAYLQAFSYILASVLGSIMAAFLGMMIGRYVF